MPHSNKRNKRKTNKYHKNNSIDQMHSQQFGKCHYCDDYGHSEDTCPLVEKAAQEQRKQECKENCSKQPTRNQSANKKNADENSEEPCDICESPHHNTIDHCTVEYVEEAHKVLMNLKDYCPFCKEAGHDLYGCETFTKAQKEQQEYQQWLEAHFNKYNNVKGPKNKKKTDDCYEKSFTYCPYCEEYGHNPYDCKLVNQPFNNKKDDTSFKKVYFPVNQKSVYLNSDKKFLRVCTVHCVCQMCRTKYSSKLNKKAVETNSTNTGSDDDAIRYCFICGANGLMDSCLWKKQVMHKYV